MQQRCLGTAPYSVGKTGRKILRTYPNGMGHSPGLKLCATDRSGIAASAVLNNLKETMSDLIAKFEAAVADSKNLSERPDNATLLKIYALYKQASVGDNTDKKPGFSDLVGRAKWDAWNDFKGTNSQDAMQQYIDLIESLS